MSRIRSFEEFWPYYVSQHSKRATRAFHFVGTNGGLLLAAGAVFWRRPMLFLWAPVFAYGLAWISHFFIEKNRPATFTYPAWSLRGDLRMLGLMWRGRMSAEASRLISGVS